MNGLSFKSIRVENLPDVWLLLESLAEEQRSFNLHVGRKWLELELGAAQNTSLWHGGELLAVLFFRDQIEALEVTFLATRGDRQGKGLMRKLYAEFRNSNALGSNVWLEVHEGNGVARKFYESVSLVQCGIRKDYYGMGQDAVLYSGKTKEKPT